MASLGGVTSLVVPAVAIISSVDPRTIGEVDR